MPARPALDIPFCATTDTGLVRKNNEDRSCADASLGLFVVIDGVGGQAAGEVASACAASEILQFVRDTGDGEIESWPFDIDPTLSTASNRLRVATLIANQRIADRIAEDDELIGMAATMAGLLLGPSRAVLGNVGDCRAYLFRGGALRQMTKDHSWVGEQVRMGLLTPEAASRHPMRNVVTRALDGDTHLIVDILEIDVQPGDVFLLCSDGLTGMVADRDITSCLLASRGDLGAACQRLVELAKRGGGKDNVTVIVVPVPDRTSG